MGALPWLEIAGARRRNLPRQAQWKLTRTLLHISCCWLVSQAIGGWQANFTELRCRWWSPSEPPPYNDASEHRSGEPVEKAPDDNKAMEANKDGGFKKNR